MSNKTLLFWNPSRFITPIRTILDTISNPRSKNGNRRIAFAKKGRLMNRMMGTRRSQSFVTSIDAIAIVIILKANRSVTAHNLSLMIMFASHSRHLIPSILFQDLIQVRGRPLDLMMIIDLRPRKGQQAYGEGCGYDGGAKSRQAHSGHLIQSFSSSPSFSQSFDSSNVQGWWRRSPIVVLGQQTRTASGSVTSETQLRVISEHY
jgi:hypothetical protein